MSFQICSRIQSYRERDANYEKLLVSKGSNSADNQCQLFVDTAVYTRNRCFRLPFSSKAGKSSVLLPSGRFKCKDMVRRIFRQSCRLTWQFCVCVALLLCQT